MENLHNKTHLKKHYPLIITLLFMIIEVVLSGLIKYCWNFKLRGLSFARDWLQNSVPFCNAYADQYYLLQRSKGSDWIFSICQG